jgi:hypothetical protein
MLPVYLLKTLVSPEPLALNPPSPSSAQPAPAAPSSVLAGPASLGWPGGTVWAGMGDLGWGGAELGLCQSQPASHWLPAGCGSKGRRRPAQSVPAAALCPAGCWSATVRNSNLVSGRRSRSASALPSLRPYELTMW